MSGDQRRSHIFQAIQASGEVSVQALIDQFGVSGMTTGRDLALLEEQRRSAGYGKAIWIARDTYRTASLRRVAWQQEAKLRIAQLAAQCLGSPSPYF